MLGITSLVFPAPDGVFARTEEFSGYNAPFSLWLNDKEIPIGKFQYTSTFYVSSETLSARAGESIKVITTNGSAENTFTIGEQNTEKTLSWLIANGVHENTITLPDNLTAGTYEVKVTNKNDHPLAVKPQETALVTVVE